MKVYEITRRLRHAAERFPGKTAIEYNQGGEISKITYGELIRRVDTLAGELRSKGFKKAERAAIISANRPEWPVAFFGIIAAGGIVVPISPGATSDEIRVILDDSECGIVFADETVYGNLKEIGANSRFIRSVFSLADERFSIGSGSPVQTVDSPAERGDTACLLYTSGTTAAPKGVELSHFNLLSNAEAIYSLGMIGEKDTVISILPLHHIYPLNATMIVPLTVGGRVVYTDSMRVERITEALRQSKVTVFVAVPKVFSGIREKIIQGVNSAPFVLRILLKAAAFFCGWLRKKTGMDPARHLFRSIHGRFGRSMRFFVSGGARLDKDVAQDLRKYGFMILEGYGLTETSPVLTMNPLNNPKAGSVGLPIPGVELRIDDADEKGEGEVLARGPGIMKGYYKRRDLTDDVIKDGWFHTGDLGYFDEDGYLFLTGRAKDIIVLSSGVNVYPEEVEEAYMRQAPLKEMCVFELVTRRGKEEILQLWAIAVPDLDFFKKYGGVDLRNVIKERFDNVSRTLPPHMRIMGFTVTMDELPRTLLGKVKRFEVKEKFTPAALDQKESYRDRQKISEKMRSTAESPIGLKVISFLAHQAGKRPEDVLPCDLLEMDLGIDSLGRVELAAGLENMLGISIDDSAVGMSFTVEDLIREIGKSPPKKADTSGAPATKDRDTDIDWGNTLAVPPKKENLEKIDLRPAPITRAANWLFIGMVRMFLRIFHGISAEGVENIPEKGPFIIYGNHTSYYDGFAIAAVLPKLYFLTSLFFIGFRPYFTVPVIRNLVKTGRIIPLDFGEHLLEALKSAYYVLSHGRNLCLFPEGLRTLDGKIAPFKKGFGILASVSGAKLVPALIVGAHEAWPRTQAFPRRYPIKVIFGKPLDVISLERKGLDMGAEDKYEAVSMAARETLLKIKGLR